MTDVYDRMAEIAGEAAGLKPQQFPGFAHILRQVAAEEREACAKIALGFAEASARMGGGITDAAAVCAERVAEAIRARNNP